MPDVSGQRRELKIGSRVDSPEQQSCRGKAYQQQGQDSNTDPDMTHAFKGKERGRQVQGEKIFLGIRDTVMYSRWQLSPGIRKCNGQEDRCTVAALPATARL